LFFFFFFLNGKDFLNFSKKIFSKNGLCLLCTDIDDSPCTYLKISSNTMATTITMGISI
jgi:hypothetical protein